jgi:hypothetical protein
VAEDAVEDWIRASAGLSRCDPAAARTRRVRRLCSGRIGRAPATSTLLPTIGQPTIGVSLGHARAVDPSRPEI